MFSLFNRNPSSVKKTAPNQPSSPSNNPIKTSTPSPSYETASNAFKQEVVSHQRGLLKDNLNKLSVPVEQQEKIIKMRNSLPDDYHKMPIEKPSRCFWLFENEPLPKQSWRTQHHIDAFKRCECELIDAVAKDEQASSGMKFI